VLLTNQCPGYAWVLSIFFFGYLICEVPSNMILSRSKPSVFLPGIMLVWGALSALMAVSKSYSAMLAFRFILGCVESGFFPGVLFLLSCWYKKAELGKRFAFFYTAAILSGAFGGLLAGGVTGHLDGAHGIAGWRWLFIIEGVATVGLSIAAYFILLDFPSNEKKFTLEERQLAVIRLHYDGMASGNLNTTHEDMTHWESFKAAWLDWRTGVFTILFMMIVGSGTISYFIPTITKTLGYTTIMAQYMTVPIYAVATVFTVCVSFNADRINDRRWHICAMLSFGFLAGLVCCVVQTPTVRYVMVCFLAAGIWSALPLCLAWVSNTIEVPTEKRAIVLATVNAFGNFSSVYGSRIWPSHGAPRYVIGFGVTTTFLGLGALIAATLPLLLKIIPVKVTEAEARAVGEKRAVVEERRASDAAA
jgi:MFS family permease